MKRKNIVAQVVSNVLLVAIIGMLAAVCLPIGKEKAVLSPYYRGSATDRVALMVNVYQGNEQVEKILHILDKYEATCTFFVGGVWAEKNSELVKKMAGYGEIGNHGYLHRDHAKISKQANVEEIVLCHKLVKATTGIEMRLFAPPSGSFSQDTLDVCEEKGYKVVMWSKDTIDWRDHDKDLIFKRATTDVKGGDLILAHPTEETVRALPAILEQYRKLGLIPSTVSDVIGAESYI